MFLDDQNFFSGPRPPRPPPPAFPHEVAVSRIILALMLLLLVMPVSAGGLAALIHYLWG